MKKRILCAAVAVIISLNIVTPSLVASATPREEVKKSQSKYEELQKKVNEINEKVSELDAQINPLAIKINENNDRKDTIEKEVNSTNKEIEQLKEDIKEKEDVLGKRLREVYKSGGQTNYLTLLFTAESFSDLILKMDSASKIINIDKKIVNELNDSKETLDTKVEELEDKAKEVETLNVEIKTKVEELTVKKDEQEVLVKEAKEEQKVFESEFLVPLERDLVKDEIADLTNPNTTLADKKAKLDLLKATTSQLKSPTVIEESKAIIQEAESSIAEETARVQAQNRVQNSNNNKTQNKTDRGDSGVTVSGNASALLNYAYKFQGLPYVWGATGPNSFDCSGFTSYVYRNAAGIDIGRTTYDQISKGRAVSQSELQPGDLVFPHTGHVGIYVGNGKMIHAPQTGDVIKIANVYKFYTARRILG